MRVDPAMDFDLADAICKMAHRDATLGRAGGKDLHASWKNVVDRAKKRLSSKLLASAREIDIAGAAVQFAGELTQLMTIEKPPKDLKALMLSIQTRVLGRKIDSPGRDEVAVMGYKKFAMNGDSWLRADVWESKIEILDIDALARLTGEAFHDEKHFWTVQTMLGLPMVMLVAGEAARNLNRNVLLDGRGSLGIATGFDGGDVWTLGRVTKRGFEPAEVPQTSDE